MIECEGRRLSPEAFEDEAVVALIDEDEPPDAEGVAADGVEMSSEEPWRPMGEPMGEIACSKDRLNVEEGVCG